MKDRTLSIIAIVLSLTAIAYTTWTRQHSRELAIEALKQREKELVEAGAPRFRDLYSDMLQGTAGFDAAKFKPTTLEELVRPILTIVTRMQGGGAEAPAPPDVK